MRLGDTLARRRLRYPRPIPTLPDLLVIDVPPVFAAPTLPLGRYYPVIVETDEEWHEWESFIAGKRDRPVAPDLLNRRPSRLIGDNISVAHYDPPVSGWPWLLLCHWPPEHVAIVPTAAEDFARAAYTVEILPDAPSRAAATTALLAALRSHRPEDVVQVLPASCHGHAAFSRAI